MRSSLLLTAAVLVASPLCSCAHESVISVPPSNLQVTGKIKYITSDAHFHFVDFLQQSDGMQALLKAMNEGGIEHSMISGLSLVKKWDAASPQRPTYYLNDDSRTYWYSMTDEIVARAVLSVDEPTRRRLHPFITGINDTDLNAVDHVKRMLEWHPDFWEGIGELFGHHDDLTALTYGETPRPNHPALDAIYDLAAANDLPVMMHTNVTPVGLPNTTLWLGELADAVSRHPNTRFVWCHAGISRRVIEKNYPAVVANFLASHPNVSVDLSWVVYGDYVAPKGIPDPEWIALVERFPTRFMIGSDTVGHFQNHVATMQQYYVFLDQLKPETAKRVARDNFLALLPARARHHLAEPVAAAIKTEPSH